MLNTIFTLQNPMIAPIMVMVATAIISFALALGVLFLTRKQFMAKSIDEHSKGELRYLHAQIKQYEKDIGLLNERIIYLKVKIASITLHLGKAVQEAGINE
ncbi:MAG: hypothetical protein DRI69_09075 [Bacteroidetes bacterium]|nr:MAG: hypothetical protein DRI69_09075 [Bacteroidota bacterium]